MDSSEAAGLLHLFCDKHVTYHRVYRAEEAGLPDPDTLWLTTADGFKIHTLEVKPEGEVKGAVICISGIENPSVTAFYGHAREFREIGLTTLMPDLRGHGDSDGDRICLACNETADIKAVTEYVKATYTDIPVIVMGCRWEEVSRSAQLERTMTSTHSSPCRHLLEFVRNVVDK